MTVRKPNIPAARIEYKMNDELTLDTAKSEKKTETKVFISYLSKLEFLKHNLTQRLYQYQYDYLNMITF